MKKQKICFICFLIAAICYFITALINFIDGDTSKAVVFLCLGSSFLCLSTVHWKKTGENDPDNT